MAIFVNNDKQPNSNSGTTIIAGGTRIKGEIVIDCSLHIDGQVEGVIRSKSSIAIGKDGQVDGEIFADRLAISGRFKGMCDCSLVEILPQGRIEGQIIAKELVIERTGYFIGESKIKEDTQNLLVGGKRDLLPKLSPLDATTNDPVIQK